MKNYYQVLGLHPGASKTAIKQAYRDLAKVWHPDRFPKDERLRLIAEEKLKEINYAYEKLSSVEYSSPDNQRAEPSNSSSHATSKEERSDVHTFAVKAKIIGFFGSIRVRAIGITFIIALIVVFGIRSVRKESQLRESQKLSLGSSLNSKDISAITNNNRVHRQEVNDFMRNSPDSPFKRDTTNEYRGIKWFPINPYFRGRSILHRYDNPETVSVYGTKGEERKNLRYAYFEFDVPDERGMPKTIRLNVYKFTPYDKRRYELYKNNLSVWFTDQTTGKETYEVGRYVEIGEENPDPNFVYTIDLNKAYNPYCAYNDSYSCAIPRKEDHLNFPVRAGEMKYHD